MAQRCASFPSGMRPSSLQFWSSAGPKLQRYMDQLVGMPGTRVLVIIADEVESEQAQAGEPVLLTAKRMMAALRLEHRRTGSSLVVCMAQDDRLVSSVLQQACAGTLRLPCHTRFFLDLHGLDQQEARQVLEPMLKQFLRLHGMRELVIVVGRGKHSARNVPVLPGAVQQVLHEFGLQYEAIHGRMVVTLCPPDLAP